jgi:serine phosphatase RsbU (regulator of sigma subunit)
METLAEAITIRDAQDTLVYANRAAIEHLGFDSWEELKRHSLHSIMADYHVYDESGEPVEMRDIPSVRLLKGQGAEPLLIHTINRRTGLARWELLKTAGLRDHDGSLLAAVTVIEDVTAVKSREVQMRILSEAGRALAASPDIGQALQELVNLVVPEVADWCVIDLVDRRLTRDTVAMTHRDPAKLGLIRQTAAFGPGGPEPESTLGRVIRTDQPRLFAEIPDRHLIEVARDPEDLARLKALEVRSAVIVPLRLRELTLGVMTVGTSESQRRLTEADLELAEQLADRIALAAETARLHTTLTRASETLQQSLIPNPPPPVPGWELAALYRPAGDGQRIEVGGDFYEVFHAGPHPIALIGDVTGHGVTAATLTALMRHGARFASRLEPQPAAILHRLDEELRQRGDSLCTALCARLGAHELMLCSAGHPPALMVDRAGSVTESPAPGPLLGAFADARFSEETVPVAPGQLVLFYTDGVTETPGARERFGQSRLRRLMAARSGATPRELLAALDAALDDFRQGEAGDDVAALALRPAG